jgi:hypothetical protein
MTIADKFAERLDAGLERGHTNPVSRMAVAETRVMIPRWSNLIGLLVASTLPLQLPICVCQSNDHSHDTSESEGHNHYGGKTAAVPHTNEFHERHSDGDEHRGHHSHSHHEHDETLPIRHEPTGGHDCAGYSGGNGHRCECAPQDVLMLHVEGGANLNSPPSDSVKWLKYTTSAFVDTSHTTSFQLLRFWPARSPVTASQGKLCALFCRWLT